jgi:putative tricarboxylic transport membrane protein
METLGYLAMGLSTALQPINLLYCFAGVFLGTLVGVLPGIGPVGAIALLLPVTFHAPPISGIIMLCGIMFGSQYGGSTTSILVNIPGEASSIITCLDGYQMARKGRAGPALGIAAFASFIAGTGSIFGLVFLAPVLAEWGLRFGPPEYFALIVFGLTVLLYLAHGSMAKAIMMALLGLMLASVGIDSLTSYPRFTYGILSLRDGLGLVQIVIGLFGVSEILITLERGVRRTIFDTEIKGLLPTLRDWKDSIFPITRGSIIGFFLGIIPGMSVVIPTFVSYALEKKISKHPEKFGTGVIEGVAAPESANNAANNGIMIPLLSLGIPCGAASALVLGAMMIYGIVPGPMLISQSPQIFWGVIGSMYIGNLMLLILNLPLIPLWVKTLKTPYPILFTLILLFCLIGSYTTANSASDMVIMIIFGLVGYLMKKFNYEMAPLVLGLVLGPIMEKNFRNSMIMFRGNPAIFFHRPISMVFLVLAMLVLVSPLFSARRKLGGETAHGEEE